MMHAFTPTPGRTVATYEQLWSSGIRLGADLGGDQSSITVSTDSRLDWTNISCSQHPACWCGGCFYPLCTCATTAQVMSPHRVRLSQHGPHNTLLTAAGGPRKPGLLCVLSCLTA